MTAAETQGAGAGRARWPVNKSVCACTLSRSTRDFTLEAAEARPQALRSAVTWGRVALQEPQELDGQPGGRDKVVGVILKVCGGRRHDLRGSTGRWGVAGIPKSPTPCAENRHACPGLRDRSTAPQSLGGEPHLSHLASRPTVLRQAREHTASTHTPPLTPQGLGRRHTRTPRTRRQHTPANHSLCLPTPHS